MIVIIDGYNLLKQIFHKADSKIENQRNQLIKELAFYKNKKTKDLKDIILVFDGGFTKHADRQIYKGLVIIFSGNKYSADDWIFDYTKKHKNEDILLVTQDKKLRSLCSSYGVDFIEVFDFYDIVQNTLLEDIKKEYCYNENEAKKYNDDFVLEEQLKNFSYNKDSSALDILMSQTEVLGINKDEEKGFGNIKRKKIPKKEKRIIKKINKL